jgi:transposase
MSTTTSPQRDDDAPPHDWKEGRRLRALELSESGWKQVRIAEALGVTRGAVSQWLTAARAGGKQALRHRPPPGATPKLTEAQRSQLPDLLRTSAERYGFVGDVWTTKRVAAVISRTFGVRYHPAHVSRLLRQIGWTVQKPIRRATQRDEAAIAAWREERWPSLKAKPRRKTARSSS